MKTSLMNVKTVPYFAALFIAMLFTACSSSEDEELNPEGSLGVVKAEFTISFPNNIAGTTRMTTATVQGQTTPVFRGIQDMKLYAFKEAETTLTGTSAGAIAIPSVISFAGGTVGKVGASGTSANIIDGDVLTNNTYNNSALYNTSKSHLYQNLEIPIGAETFMFYGQALRQSTENNFAEGTLVPSLGSSDDNTLGAITFSPQPISSATTVTNNGTYIANYLTAIATAKTTDGTTWKDTDAFILGILYNQFTSITAGSWASIKGAVQQLYTTLLNRPEALSTAIKKAITETTYAENSKFVTKVENGILTFAEMGDFPADMGLPDGAAYVSFSNNQFSYDLTKQNTNINYAGITDYAYPAALYYRALSGIKVSSTSKASEYKDDAEWTNIVNSYNESDNTKVKGNTHSIIMVDPVQYAVGRLDVTIQATDWSLPDFSGQTVQPIGTNFQLTGVLVGNQSPVDYQFQPIRNNTTKLYTLYDRNINNNGEIYLTTANPTNTTINHTLVLETPESTTGNEENAKVKIALEFKNNTGKALKGKDNCIIYPGTKFYLVGELDPSDTSANTTNTNNIKQAFKQDYVTTANFQIKNFEKAYNTLPDLRSPELEMGLSVDLTWQQGIKQTIIIQ
ncbi:MAG: hypothetical protein IJ693_03850 [Bacteroidaceae bacterium]|nr:hypothetical protein [Bacteroidaceae bacterium]